MTMFVLVGIVVAAVTVINLSNRHLVLAVNDAARACGMNEMRNGDMVAFVGGFEARLVKIGKHASLQYSLKPLLTSEANLRRVFFSSDRTDATGIEELDSQLRFEGKGAVACACIGPIAADFLELFREPTTKLEAGVLALPINFPVTRERIRERLDRLKVLGIALTADGAAMPRRLARVVANVELSPRARQKALEHLVRDYPSSSEAKDALATCVDAAPHELRFSAAVLGNMPERMASFAKDEHASMSARTAMLAHYETSAGLNKTIALLRELALSQSEEMSIIAIERLGKRGDFDSAARMITWVHSASPRRRMALLQALSSLADSAQERALRDLLLVLDGDEVGAAARVLGKIGTVGSVPALHTGRDRLGLLDVAAKREVDLAILRIKSRQDGASAGQISLNDDSVGAVSINDDSGAQRARVAPKTSA